MGQCCILFYPLYTVIQVPASGQALPRHRGLGGLQHLVGSSFGGTTIGGTTISGIDVWLDRRLVGTTFGGIDVWWDDDWWERRLVGYTSTGITLV